ncbi:hypothetical protein QFC21_006828 [Naganishia friedmannii]|uniref:Uncharacterized protein n=1 Tax=Naganishia friedmannii TaxID=89922 RepID=A0ACC2V0T1_9TREE|nr:hypothetical protein QFC21_006828 [Naganishia friedmannii]
MAASAPPVRAILLPPAPKVVFPDGYTMIRELGSGAYATVYEACRASDGTIVAIKVVDMTNMDAREQQSLKREMSIQASLDHCNIVKLLKVVPDSQRNLMFVVLELCPGGDLGELIERQFTNNRYIPEDTIWSYLQQLASALEHLHEPDSRSASASTVILHRDIKPANILLSEDLLEVKLADFGLARETEVEEWATTFCGTMDYMSPEMCTKAISTNEASDIWSLGCVIYELCALQPLFVDDDDEKLMQLIRAGASLSLPSAYSKELREAIASMLAVNPLQRPSAAFLLEVIESRASVPSASLAETLEENQVQRCRISELEALVAFLQQNAAAQEQVAAEQRREDEAERGFYDREISRLKKKADAEKDTRQNCQAALASAKARIQQMEQQTVEQEADFASRVATVASREAAVQLREKSLIANLACLETRERSHQTTIQIKSEEPISLPPRSNIRRGDILVTIPVAGYSRSPSSSSCSSSGHSSDSSSSSGSVSDKSSGPASSKSRVVRPSTVHTSRIPKPVGRECMGAAKPMIARRRNVDVASIAKAGIAAAAASGKRKLEAFNDSGLSTASLVGVHKRSRGHLDLVGLRQRM